MKSVEEQLKIMKKGVEQLIGEEELKTKLERCIKEGKSLVIKFGLDPSAPDIHLGHAVALRKLRQMQDLGHKVVIIIGDFTGKIGDPTGKSKTRKPLSEEQVMQNALTYQEQIFRVLDRDKTEVRFNSEWLDKLNFTQVIQLAATTTVARMLERDEFTKRFQANEPIGVHEFFYPLMQAYDSIAIKPDIELGGTDQTFNILMGRTLMKTYGLEPQAAMFLPILEGTDGVEKMSKSLGNYIGVNEPAEVMFKKVMEIPDSLIIKYFELTTDEHPDTIEVINEELTAGKNPRDVKLQLASIITKLYHGEDAMKSAQEFYDQAFRQKGIPDEIPELRLGDGEIALLDIMKRLVEGKYVASGSEFRRLVAQGGVLVNGERLMDVDFIFVDQETVLRIGKKKFVKVIKDMIE